jgi:hypothetical protein
MKEEGRDSATRRHGDAANSHVSVSPRLRVSVSPCLRVCSAFSLHPSSFILQLGGCIVFALTVIP